MVDRQDRAEIAAQDARERKMLSQIFGWRGQIVWPLVGFVLCVVATAVFDGVRTLWR